MKRVINVISLLLIFSCYIPSFLFAKENKSFSIEILNKKGSIELSQIPWGIQPDALKKLIPDKYHVDLPIRGASCSVQRYIEDSEQKIHFAATVTDRSKLSKLLREDFLFYFDKNGLWAVKIKFKSENYTNSLTGNTIAQINTKALAKKVKIRSKSLFKKYKSFYGKPSKKRVSTLPTFMKTENFQTKAVTNEWNGIEQLDNKIFVKLTSGVISHNKYITNRDLTELYIDKSRMPLAHLLIPAMYRNDSVKVKRLIDDGANVNYINIDTWLEHYTPLIYATSQNNIKIVELLLKKGANVNYMTPDGTTALNRAIYDERRNIVDMLLAAGADVTKKDKSGWTPLLQMANNTTEPDISILVSIIEAGADVNYKAKGIGSALELALYRNQLSFMEKLIEYGAKINVKDKYGKTLFERAENKTDKRFIDVIKKGKRKQSYAVKLLKKTISGEIESIMPLLEKGASFNLRDNNGNNALFFAIGNGRIEIAKLLLIQGANINCKNNKGWTPLMAAVSKANIDMIKLLLSNGADLNVQKPDGVTALMIAAYKGNEEVVKILLAANAKKTLKDKKRNTAIDHAMHNNHKSIVFLLK